MPFHKHQILYPVIIQNSILVVNNFIWFQKSPNMFFHYQPMFSNPMLITGVGVVVDNYILIPPLIRKLFAFAVSTILFPVITAFTITIFADLKLFD